MIEICVVAVVALLLVGLAAWFASQQYRAGKEEAYADAMKSADRVLEAMRTYDFQYQHLLDRIHVLAERNSLESLKRAESMAEFAQHRHVESLAEIKARSDAQQGTESLESQLIGGGAALM